MAYSWNGDPDRALAHVKPDLAEHKRRPPRTHSFGNDEEARLAAKRETNRAYFERNRERVLARQRAWYAKNKKSPKKGLDTVS